MACFFFQPNFSATIQSREALGEVTREELSDAVKPRFMQMESKVTRGRL